MDKENFKASLQELIDKFERSEEYYKSKSYKEDELRQEFINPLFKALGWDMDNKAGVAPQYRDVIHEDRIEIEGKPKAPDYSFKIGPERKFFVEAKAASVKIISEFPPSFQLRRYAWSGKLPVSILTDFEEFSVYDSTIEPKQSDKTETARIKYIHYKDYLKEADYLWETFSKDAVWKGSFDKFAKAEKRGNQLVDKSFLTEIETWRSLLAKDIATNNSDIDIYQLNEAVQKIIDRIIFLRIAEDRGIEFYETLKKTIESKDTYKLLVNIFKRAQDKYNSNLFDFNADSLTTKLKISDKVLDRIIGSMYYPKSPFEFSVIGVEILGSVYEQFLGKVIRLTKGHNAIIEEKPEVKKAGGVYYTPQYIVDYIINNTVGELTKDKTPKEVSKLRIVDPACGSGSFLIGAYNFLLDWHLKYYVENDTEKHIKASTLFKDMEGNYFLSTAEKKRILLNNIYGVDIDSQAVEVTKLSLALKMMENENSETINKQLKLFADRILPDLGSNIKCGNSLIGSDYYSDKNLSLLSDEEIRKVNAFDWDKEFSEVFKQGGFDAVVGNPPYIRVQTLNTQGKELIDYFKGKYKSADKGNYDIYVLFIEKGLSILSSKGLLGFILPHKFMNALYGQGVRKIISESKSLSRLVYFGDNQIFENATTYTCLLFLNTQKKQHFDYQNITNLKEWQLNSESYETSQIELNNASSSEWNFITGNKGNLYQKLSTFPTLGEYAHLFVGVQTDADSVFILEEIKQEGDIVYCKSKETGEVHQFENEHLKYFVKGSVNIDRYSFKDMSKRLIFPYIEKDGRSVLINSDEYKKQFPLTWNYLELNKSRLSSRNKGKLAANEWYGYVYKKNHLSMTKPKILVPSIAKGVSFNIDLEGKYFFAGSGGGGGGGYGVIPNDNEFSTFYILGLLNSSVSNFYINLISTKFRGGYLALNKQFIEKLPVKKATADIENEVSELVKEMLRNYHSINDMGITEIQRGLLKQRVKGIDDRLNNLFYGIFGLTKKEIDIIEESL